MRVYIGADHAGYELKAHLKPVLEAQGVEVVDVGTEGPESVDYPDFAKVVARAVSEGEVERGILICGTGIGMSITANKFPGVRAGLVNDLYAARMCREHNDCNILVLAARVVDYELAPQIVDTWLATPFAGDRHARRVGKISDIESELSQGEPCESS